MNVQINQSASKSPEQTPCYKLMLVTQQGNIPTQDYVKFIQTCAASGITSVQLREKNKPYAALLELGKNIQEILAPYLIPLIINDNIELALALDAAGVHLGQTDCCPQKARDQLGPKKIIGVSIDSLANLQHANQLPINYVGIGSIFPTQNKTNVTHFWGTAGLKQVAPLSTHPIIAIGGINEHNATEVMLAGAHGIAAIGAFHHAVDLPATTKKLRQIINNIQRSPS